MNDSIWIIAKENMANYYSEVLEIFDQAYTIISRSPYEEDNP